MNTPLSWIKAYVPDLNVSDQEYTDAMTLSGTKVEGFKALDAELNKIVIGKIEKIEKHPDADKLTVCSVNIDTETIQIVTNAKNIKEGDKVPVVLDQGTVSDGTKIKKGKLRGVESFGMFCSIEEFGSNTDMYPEAPEDGVYVFKEEAPTGADAIEYLGFRDSVFEYEVTSNRPDCFSVIGIAREAAATFSLDFKPPVVNVNENSENVNDYASVEVIDKDLCTRYCGRVVKNVKIGPSPEWMQRRLAKCGIRPINNLVDITNYVMEEYGQPMHAFDLNTIKDRKIIVKRAKDGEEFVTLDGQTRNLDSEILMICDSEKYIGIGGIMGGENSMITDDVKDVLFEAACFDGTNIRLSSKRIGLRTDSSSKFEKGLDSNNAIEAVNRACQLIEELGAGEVVGGTIDINNSEKKELRIEFDDNRINNILGTKISKDEMISYLERLELIYDSNTNKIIVPSFRPDIEHIADVSEEVARLYGYDKIPTTLPKGEATTGKLSYKLRVEDIAKQAAKMCGFSQGMSYSFESPKVFDKLLIPSESEIRKAVTISNPLGEDYSIMRTISLNGILSSLSTNYNRRNKDVRLYELANIYIPKEIPVKQLPEERIQFTLGMYGEGDFFTMKGVVEEFFSQAGMDKKVSYDNSDIKPFLHPGRQADIKYNGKIVGYLGEVHPLVLENYEIGQRAYIAVIDMSEIYEHVSFERKYVGVPKYPAITRDISMVMPKSIMVSQIEDIIEKKGTSILESVSLFDIYEGEQIKENCKSVAYKIVFRAKDRTLEDNDVTPIMDKIIKALGEMDIELRS